MEMLKKEFIEKLSQHDSAFPLKADLYDDSTSLIQQGLTRREYFAAKILTAFIAKPPVAIAEIIVNQKLSPSTAYAKASLLYADALIVELAK